VNPTQRAKALRRLMDPVRAAGVKAGEIVGEIAATGITSRLDSSTESPGWWLDSVGNIARYSERTAEYMRFDLETLALLAEAQHHTQALIQHPPHDETSYLRGIKAIKKRHDSIINLILATRERILGQMRAGHDPSKQHSLDSVEVGLIRKIIDSLGWCTRLSIDVAQREWKRVGLRSLTARLADMSQAPPLHAASMLIEIERDLAMSTKWLRHYGKETGDQTRGRALLAENIALGREHQNAVLSLSALLEKRSAHLGRELIALLASNAAESSQAQPAVAKHKRNRKGK